MSMPDRWRRFSGVILLAGAIAGWRVGAAQSIGDALPLAVPGFAVAPGVTALSRLHREDLPAGITLSGLPPDLTIHPSIGTGIGWDSAPGSANSSSVAGQIEPRVRLDDAALGLVLYAGADLERYATTPAADTSDVTAGGGIIVPLGPETVTIGAARVATRQTALGLAQAETSAPLGVVIDAARAALRRSLGVFDETVRIGFSQAALSAVTGGLPPGFHGRSSFEVGATLETADDAVLRELVTAHTDIVRYQGAVAADGFADGDDFSLIGGIETDAAAITRLRVLGGLVRQNFAGGTTRDVTTPIISAGLGWAPDGLVSLELDITRDAGLATTLGTPGTVVNTARLALAEAYARNVLLTFDLDARSGVVANHMASEIDATATARFNVSRSLAISQSLLIARRHDLPGSASREMRALITLVWSR